MWTRLARKLARYRRILRFAAKEDVELNSEQQAFVQKYNDSRFIDRYNKINPICIAVVDHMSEINGFIENATSPDEIIAQFFQWINEYNDEASNVNMPTEVFNYADTSESGQWGSGVRKKLEKFKYKYNRKLKNPDPMLIMKFVKDNIFGADQGTQNNASIDGKIKYKD